MSRGPLAVRANGELGSQAGGIGDCRAVLAGREDLSPIRRRSAQRCGAGDHVVLVCPRTGERLDTTGRVLVSDQSPEIIVAESVYAATRVCHGREQPDGTWLEL